MADVITDRPTAADAKPAPRSLYTPRKDSAGRYWKLDAPPVMRTTIPSEAPPLPTGEALHVTTISVTIACRHGATQPPDFEHMVRQLLAATLRAAEE